MYPFFADCTIFGHLVQFVYIPMEIPQKQFIKDKCPNLEEFVDRMKKLLWPDWDEMCHGNCMEGKKAIDLQWIYSWSMPCENHVLLNQDFLKYEFVIKRLKTYVY